MRRWLLLSLLGLLAGCGDSTDGSTSSSSSSTSSSSSSGSGGASAGWDLLIDGTLKSEPSSIALLPDSILMETVSYDGDPATLATVPYAGGGSTELASLGALTPNDPVAIATDAPPNGEGTVVYVAHLMGGDQLATLPAKGGTPKDLIPLSAMQTAYPLLGVKSGLIYYQDATGIVSKPVKGGASTPVYTGKIDRAVMSDQSFFVFANHSIFSLALSGGKTTTIAAEPGSILAMSAYKDQVAWLTDIGDGRNTTVNTVSISDANDVRALNTAEYHAIAAIDGAVLAFAFDGDELATMDHIDSKTAEIETTTTPFEEIVSVKLRDDVPFVVVLGTVLTEDSPKMYSYHPQIRVHAR